MSRNSSNPKESERREARLIDEANEKLSRRGKKNGVIRFNWLREREDVSCFTFKENAASLSEARTDVLNNVSAMLLVNACGCFDTTLLWSFIMGFWTTIRVAMEAIERKAVMRN